MRPAPRQCVTHGALFPALGPAVPVRTPAACATPAALRAPTTTTSTMPLAADAAATRALEEATMTIIRRTWLRPSEAQADAIRAQLTTDPEFEAACAPFLSSAHASELDRVINDCHRKLVNSEGGMAGLSDHWNNWHQLYLDEDDEGVRDGHYDDYGRMI